MPFLPTPIFTGRNEVLAKVIFLHLSVIHSVHRRGSTRPGTPLPQDQAGTPPGPGRYPPPQETDPPPGSSRLRNTVNARPVRILPECILVYINILINLSIILINSFFILACNLHNRAHFCEMIKTRSNNPAFQCKLHIFLTSFACNLHNRAHFYKTIKTRCRNPMFWLKPHIILNICLHITH